MSKVASHALIPIVEDLARELRALLARVKATGGGSPAAVDTTGFDRAAQRIELAKFVLHYRAMRGRMMPMFTRFEPNWEIALHLYVVRDIGRAQSLADLTTVTGLSIGAIRRRVMALMGCGTIERAPAPNRGRSHVYALTEQSAARIDDYLDAILMLMA